MKKFHITISYGDRKLIDCESVCAAVIDNKSAATCCVSENAAVRILLATKTEIYLNSLLDTIATDTGLDKGSIQFIMEELKSDIQLDSKRVDIPKSASEAIDDAIDKLIKKVRRSGGDGNG